MGGPLDFMTTSIKLTPTEAPAKTPVVEPHARQVLKASTVKLMATIGPRLLSRSTESVRRERLLPTLNRMVEALLPAGTPGVTLAPMITQTPVSSDTSRTVLVVRGPAWMREPKLGNEEGAISTPKGSGPRLSPTPPKSSVSRTPAKRLSAIFMEPPVNPNSNTLPLMVPVPEISRFVGRGINLPNKD